MIKSKKTRTLLIGRSVLFAASLVVAGRFETTRADFLIGDGDFNAQIIGTPPRAPWTGAGMSASANAQSPFENVYPKNGKGLNVPASAGNPALIGGISPAIPGDSP